MCLYIDFLSQNAWSNMWQDRMVGKDVQFPLQYGVVSNYNTSYSLLGQNLSDKSVQNSSLTSGLAFSHHNSEAFKKRNYHQACSTR